MPRFHPGKQSPGALTANVNTSRDHYTGVATWITTKVSNMVIGLLFLTAIPTVTGVAQGVSQQRAQNAEKADEKRMAKFNLDANCETKSSRAKDIRGKRVVLRNGKVGRERRR